MEIDLMDETPEAATPVTPISPVTVCFEPSFSGKHADGASLLQVYQGGASRAEAWIEGVQKKVRQF